MVGKPFGHEEQHFAFALGDPLQPVRPRPRPPGRALESWSYLPEKLVLSNAADVLGQVHAVAVKAPRLPTLGLAYLDLLLYLVVALGLGAWRINRDS